MLVGGSLATFAVPGLIGEVVDCMQASVTSTMDWDRINQLCLFMLILIGVSAVCGGLRGVTFNTISEKIAFHIRYDLFLQLVNKDVEFFDANKTGELLSRMSSDTTIIQDGLSTNVSMILRSLIFIVFSLFIMFFISKQLALITLIGILPILVAGGFFAKAVKRI